MTEFWGKKNSLGKSRHLKLLSFSSEKKKEISALSTLSYNKIYSFFCFSNMCVGNAAFAWIKVVLQKMHLAIQISFLFKGWVYWLTCISSFLTELWWLQDKHVSWKMGSTCTLISEKSETWTTAPVKGLQQLGQKWVVKNPQRDDTKPQVDLDMALQKGSTEMWWGGCCFFF